MYKIHKFYDIQENNLQVLILTQAWLKVKQIKRMVQVPREDGHVGISEYAFWTLVDEMQGLTADEVIKVLEQPHKLDLTVEQRVNAFKEYDALENESKKYKTMRTFKGSDCTLIVCWEE